MTEIEGIAGDRICSFVERIEHIDEEIKALERNRIILYRAHNHRI